MWCQPACVVLSGTHESGTCKRGGVDGPCVVAGNLASGGH
jgi:hypothetical protein